MRFEDYLAEAFGPRTVAYGMNQTADDSKFELFHGRLITDLIYKDDRFRISYDKSDGEVVFANRTEGNHNIKPIRASRTSLDIYNRIAFVVMKLLEHAKATEFHFQGDSDDLKQLYSKFIANQSFQRMIRERGWRYEGEKYEGHYQFKKVSK